MAGCCGGSGCCRWLIFNQFLDDFEDSVDFLSPLALYYIWMYKTRPDIYRQLSFFVLSKGGEKFAYYLRHTGAAGPCTGGTDA
jgi:hypothetical protein